VTATAMAKMTPSPPWYRQFWPWFLIALPGTVVVASIYTLVLATRHADDLVVDEYYREGLSINRQLERTRAAEDLGIDATLTAEGRQIDVRITGPVDQPQLRLLLSHPMESARDFKVPLKMIGAGSYRGAVPQALSGRWIWIVDAGDGSAWRVDGEQYF